ncbi:MAG: pyridoxal-phosphate-dependent aminotransferase family protein, partial [Sphingomonadaceae bacterium]
VLDGIKKIFKTEQPVVIYPASGTGAWEAALSNTLSPGDTVLMFETGHFATLWKKMAENLGIRPEFLGLPGVEGWRHGVQADMIEARLRADTAHAIKAVCVVHNETSTGVTSDIAAVRRAIDAAGHPALLLVDTISGLASADYRHDEWGVDVTVSGSQKGLMLPPGLSFNAVSDKALAASKAATLPRSFWDWQEMLVSNEKGYFPYTPSTNLLQGLKVAIEMLQAEGLDKVFLRHQRAAEATRRAVRHWGFETQCVNEDEYSASLTAVRLPEGHSADALRSEILARCNMSLGNGLGQLADKVFRIGHLGDFHDLMVLGTLSGVEVGLKARGIPYRSGGVEVATHYLAGNAGPFAEDP